MEKKRLESLIERKAKIEQQIAALKARETAQERKDTTRLKILIGAAILADMKINPDIASLVNRVLQRAITEKRDIDFLQTKGWLHGDTPKDGQ